MFIRRKLSEIRINKCENVRGCWKFTEQIFGKIFNKFGEIIEQILQKFENKWTETLRKISQNSEKFLNKLEKKLWTKF